jgi:cell division protein FtsZ
VAAGPDRARIAAEQAVVRPLLEGIDPSAPRRAGALAITAYEGFKPSESKLAS